MSLGKFVQYLTILGSLISPALVSFAMPPPLFEEPQQHSRLVSVKFPPAPNRDRPASTGGGGRRSGPCTERNQTSLKALIPSDKVVTTVAPNPTMLWYIPKAKASSAEFTIVDKEGNSVYSQQFDLPGSPGLVKLSLPKTVSLEVGQSYFWQLGLICNPLDRTKDQTVWGSLERIALSENQSERLKAASNPLEEAQLYADFYIWNETLGIIANLRNSKPEQWQELLNSVGIEEKEIVEAPFVLAIQH